MAVFTTGHAWAFKSWPWPDPAELFHRTCGFALRWADEPAPGSSAAWNVTPLVLHRNRPHTHVTVVYAFWTKLEAWIARNKPGLFS